MYPYGLGQGATQSADLATLWSWWLAWFRCCNFSDVTILYAALESDRTVIAIADENRALAALIEIPVVFEEFAFRIDALPANRQTLACLHG